MFFDCSLGRSDFDCAQLRPEVQAAELADPPSVFFITEINGQIAGYGRRDFSAQSFAWLMPECYRFFGKCPLLRASQTRSSTLFTSNLLYRESMICLAWVFVMLNCLAISSST